MQTTRITSDLRGRSIEELTRSCIHTFGRLLGSDLDTNRLENALADFRLWADGVGALAQSSASLDSRLMDRPDDLALVKSILALLLSFLGRLERIGPGDKNDEGCPEIHDFLRSIDSSLKNLSLIGVAIRRTGRASRSRKAEKSFNPANHTEFRKHLERIIVRPFGRKYGHDVHDPAPSKLSELQDRLIEANLRRRHYFLTAQKHSWSLKDHSQRYNNEKTDTQVLSTGGAPNPASSSEPNATLHRDRRMKFEMTLTPAAPSTAAVHSKASTPRGPLRPDQEINNPAVARTQITVIAADTEFPKQPGLREGRQLFLCPCCCQTIPNTQSWREHLIEDIRPYTCVAVNCPTPYSLFTTRDEWERHINQDHLPGWICVLCEEANLESMGHAAEHVRMRHPEEVNNYGISIVVSWCAVRPYGLTSCPVCTDEGPQDDPELVDHVLTHAYDFALRSLPWAQDPLEDLNKPVGTYNLPTYSCVDRWILDKWPSEIGQVEDKLSLKRFLQDRFLEWVEHSSTSVDVDAMTNHQSYLLEQWSSNEQSKPEELDYFATNDYFDQRSQDDCSETRCGRSSRNYQSGEAYEPREDHESVKDYQSGEDYESGPGEKSGEDGKPGEDHKSGHDVQSEDLIDRLIGELKESCFDTGKEFWPHGSIEQILTARTIADKLADDRGQMPPNGLVNFIDHDCQKTFAIVLCCNLEGQKLLWAMQHFESLKFKDAYLPITGDQFENIFFSSAGKYRDPWSRLSVRIFNTYQWKSIAPVFNNRIRELRLEREDVFPFIWSSQRGTSGMFGDVHEVTIHPAHRTHNANVAIKKLHRAYTEDEPKMRQLESEWQKEVLAHKEIAKLSHSNIIKFMTAITRDYERYLMFEWADGGNLRELWIRDSPSLSNTLVRDIIAQLRGLADALEKIHSKGFRHGDMKPENILRFKSPNNGYAIGALKICDMGLTKYHYLATQLRQQATDTKFTTFRYEPPESADEKKAWSRRYDMWSMGCIVLEFIVWVVFGTQQLDNFNRQIVNEFGNPCHYFEMVVENGQACPKVHTVVCEMMGKLARTPACQPGRRALGDLLGVVRTKLLVVRLEQTTSDSNRPQEFNANTQITRAHAVTLRVSLDDIIRTGNQNPSYWAKG